MEGANDGRSAIGLEQEQEQEHDGVWPNGLGHLTTYDPVQKINIMIIPGLSEEGDWPRAGSHRQGIG